MRIPNPRYTPPTRPRWRTSSQLIVHSLLTSLFVAGVLGALCIVW